MDFIKHDLNQQIKQVKNQQKEVNQYKLKFQNLEEKMAVTIQDHKDTIERFQSGDIIDQQDGLIKQEQGQYQNTIDSLRKENQQLVQQAMLADDHKNNLEAKSRDIERKNQQMQEKLDKLQM